MFLSILIIFRVKTVYLSEAFVCPSRIFHLPILYEKASREGREYVGQLMSRNVARYLAFSCINKIGLLMQLNFKTPVVLTIIDFQVEICFTSSFLRKWANKPDVLYQKPEKQLESHTLEYFHRAYLLHMSSVNMQQDGDQVVDKCRWSCRISYGNMHITLDSLGVVSAQGTTDFCHLSCKWLFLNEPIEQAPMHISPTKCKPFSRRPQCHPMSFNKVKFLCCYIYEISCCYFE